VPLGIAPYRHAPEDFLDHRSQTGCFLHGPVVHIDIYCRDFVGEARTRWTEAFPARGVEGGALAWCFHPYEVLNRRATRASRELLRLLLRQLDELVQDYGVTFASLAEVGAWFGGW